MKTTKEIYDIGFKAGVEFASLTQAQPEVTGTPDTLFIRQLPKPKVVIIKRKAKEEDFPNMTQKEIAAFLRAREYHKKYYAKHKQEITEQQRKRTALKNLNKLKK